MKDFLGLRIFGIKGFLGMEAFRDRRFLGDKVVFFGNRNFFTMKLPFRTKQLFPRHFFKIIFLGLKFFFLGFFF